jgi:hypothetical protein
VTKRQARTDGDLEALIAEAGDSVSELVDAYEPTEALYRNATTLTQVYPEASNTTGLPRALVVNATSAR